MSATLIVRTVHGVEWVCAGELAGQLPPAAAASLSMAHRQVTCQVSAVGPELTGLRTADDVFLQVGLVDRVGSTRDVPPVLAQRLGRLDWRHWLAVARQVWPVPAHPRFEVVASVAGRRRFNRYEVEHALGAVLEPVLGGTYLARTARGLAGRAGDLTVRVFLPGPVATAALRLGPRPLHRRAYKQDTGAGTLHPPLAAVLVRLADPHPAVGVLADPFAGDGTIPIEAALAYPGIRTLASDLDPARLANLRANAGRAGVDPLVVRADAGRLPWRPGRVGAVVANPPWNLAVDAQGALASGAGGAGGSVGGTGGSVGGTGRPGRPGSGGLDRVWRRLPELLAPGARVCLLTDAGLAVPQTLARLGYRLALATRLRVAGRVCQLVLAAPPGDAAQPALPPDLARWRDRALAAGVVTEAGF